MENKKWLLKAAEIDLCILFFFSRYVKIIIHEENLFEEVNLTQTIHV